VTVDAAGTSGQPNDLEFEIIDAAIAEWNTKTAQCSFMQIVNNGRQALEVGRDRVNLIKIRDTTWGRPAVGDDAARTYSPNAAGLTTAVFVDDATSDRDGAIVDADIEINNVNFAVTIDGQGGATGQSCDSELQNTLTHELGHLLGLEHPCLDSGDPARIDDKGNAVPTCDAVRRSPAVPANAKIMEATMYNFQDCGETKKESLSTDEITAICEIYPTADDPGSCEGAGATDGGCCSASDGGRPAWGMLLAGATLLTVLRRRKIR
jgi:MYXO-CTERM domain-containing protein